MNSALISEGLFLKLGMPFVLLNAPKQDKASPSPQAHVLANPTAAHKAPKADMAAPMCNLQLRVDAGKKKFSLTPVGDGGVELKKFEHFGIGTRRFVLDHVLTDDPNLSSELDQLKKRKGMQE